MASLIHLVLPVVPALTACVVLGIVFAALPFNKAALTPGFATASRRVLRIGVVLLGFKLSLVDVAGLGWLTLLLVVAIVVITFVVTLLLGRAMRLPGETPLLIAAGFSICGASAIGAMAGVTKSRTDDTATPVALVTLCGTLAIAVLPALRPVFGLDDAQFGMWVGASVHDVGQVVATAQVAGAAALAIAIVVKLARVALLAPMVAITAAVLRRRDGDSGAARPPLLPLFVAGFLSAVLARTFLPLSTEFLYAVDGVQFVLLGIALFGLGTAIRLGSLLRTGGRALAVAGMSWVMIAALSLGAVFVVTA